MGSIRDTFEQLTNMARGANLSLGRRLKAADAGERADAFTQMADAFGLTPTPAIERHAFFCSTDPTDGDLAGYGLARGESDDHAMWVALTRTVPTEHLTGQWWASGEADRTDEAEVFLFGRSSFGEVRW